MKLNYYWAIFQLTNNTGGNTTVQVVDCCSHPFIWMRIQKEIHAREWICLNWKEISEEEYAYIWNTGQNKY